MTNSSGVNYVNLYLKNKNKNGNQYIYWGQYKKNNFSLKANQNLFKLFIRDFNFSFKEKRIF